MESRSTRFSFRRKGSRPKESKDKEVVNDADKLIYLSAKEAKELFSELVNEYRFSTDQLMELCGFSCAVAIAKTYPKESLTKGKGSILVCCGPGKNGAVGLVCARHLKIFGYKPTVFHPKPPPASSPCSAICYNLATQCEKTDIPFLLYLPSDAQLVTDSYSLIVDAIFGNGYQPPMASDFAAIIQTLIRSKVPVISIDIPSGWYSPAVANNEDGSTAAVVNQQQDGPTSTSSQSDSQQLQPEMLISLMGPAASSRPFTGRCHVLGGRFIPSDLVKKYELDRLPPYPGLDVFVDLRTAGPPVSTSGGNGNDVSGSLEDGFLAGVQQSTGKETSAKGKNCNGDE